MSGETRSTTKGYRGVAMEGSIARWYARTRGTDAQIAKWRRQADLITRDVPAGGDVLEVAPGPGYFSIELARLGRVKVHALEISRSFVQITTENARRAGVEVDIRQGDASRMPYPDSSFNLVVCQAAFKNYSRPQEAVNEMYRVLRPGGLAQIEDMRREATDAAIHEEVRSMRLGRFRSAMTRSALRSLRRRAYTGAQFQAFATASPFREAAIETTGIGLVVRLHRSAPTMPG